MGMNILLNDGLLTLDFYIAVTKPKSRPSNNLMGSNAFVLTHTRVT
jgi:hypothetical protein